MHESAQALHATGSGMVCRTRTPPNALGKHQGFAPIPRTVFFPHLAFDVI
jgi:hypothetical protein